MFWPLIGGFIAFVLLSVFLGWILDPTRRDQAAEAEPRPPTRPHTRA